MFSFVYAEPTAREEGSSSEEQGHSGGSLYRQILERTLGPGDELDERLAFLDRLEREHRELLSRRQALNRAKMERLQAFGGETAYNSRTGVLPYVCDAPQYVSVYVAYLTFGVAQHAKDRCEPVESG